MTKLIETTTQMSDDVAIDSMDFSDDDGKSCSKEGVEIQPMDVLCGRGKNSFNHVGNRTFRDIVAVEIPGYVAAASRATKSEIVASIVRQVREGGGRFLKRDGKRGVWYVLNHTQSKEKAGHAIRDATITEESKRQRAKKRKLQRAAAAETGRKPSPVMAPAPAPTSGPSPTTAGSSSTTSATSISSSSSTSSSSDEELPIFTEGFTEEERRILSSVITTTGDEDKQLELSSVITEDEDYEPSRLFSVVTPLPMEQHHHQQQEQPIGDHVKSLDEPASVECLSSMLFNHFPQNLFPDEVPSCSGELMDPLPIDDPFNSYIDQLLGPMPEF